MQFVLDAEVEQEFRRSGFAVTSSPLSSAIISDLCERHDEIRPEWESTDWPDEVHKLASQFALIGEPAFLLAEEPAFLDAARSILEVDEVFVGACAAGDTVTAESIDGRPVTSLQWHCAPGRGGPYGQRWDQVAFRFPMDEHNPANGGLHLVPGTQDTAKKEAEISVREAVSGSADFLEWQGLFFGTHPDQVELYPVPGEMIIWTPDLWHCTGANPQHLRRRSITWTYFPEGGRFRDHATLRYVLGDEVLASWSSRRRRLWGFDA